MKELKIPYHRLSSKQIEGKYPIKDLSEDYFGFFQKDEGIINLNATLKTLFSIANDAANIDLKDFSKVTDIESQKCGDIIVTSDEQFFKTKKLVIAPGAFVNDALRHFGLSVNIDIREMSSAYYKKTEDIKLPTWFVFQKPQNTSLFYGFPEVDLANPDYFRVAPDIPDRIIKDPSGRTGIPSETSLKLNSDWVKNHMKGLDPTPDFTSTCLITLN